MRNTMGVPLVPALRYSDSRFSLNSLTPYVDETLIWNTS